MLRLGTIGANAATYRVFGHPLSVQLALLMIFGLLGYLLRRFHYPIAPVVVGLILGPMAEAHLRRALQTSQGDWFVLWDSWIAGILWIAAVAALLVPMYLRWRGSKVMEQIGAATRTDRSNRALIGRRFELWVRMLWLILGAFRKRTAP